MFADTFLSALMPADRFLLLAFYVMALTETPGPANMAFVAVSGSHSIAHTLPFLAGSLFGFTLTFCLAAAGLLAMLSGVPLLWQGLKIAYITYLAWLIATAPVPAAAPSPSPGADKDPGEGTTERQAAAPGFLHGFWIHPLNPKTYAMQIAAISQFTSPQHYGADATVIGLTFFFLGGAMNFCWVAGGRLLSYVVRTPRITA
ncbi:LysE family transporter [Breoghania sp.]|uniref:LysE family translocator n=1 Tax=Breoghania sp. TaxID=2065378 RepID=UPI00263246B2|nr:LysE family transporter [Breoghania sp.]MDJ0932278.1 LysE family transporter [Breoghania sp.]